MQCKKCGIEKPASEFGNNTKGELRKKCLSCEQMIKMEYRVKYRAKKNEAQKKWMIRKKPRRNQLSPIIAQRIEEMLPESGETFYGIAQKLGIYEATRKKYNTNICVYLYLCAVSGVTPNLPE